MAGKPTKAERLEQIRQTRAALAAMLPKDRTSTTLGWLNQTAPTLRARELGEPCTGRGPQIAAIAPRRDRARPDSGVRNTSN